MNKVYKIFDIVESDLYHTFIISSLIFILIIPNKFRLFHSITVIFIAIYE